jgi:hypothetical protein
MPAYPSCRYAVQNGVLKSEVIKGPAQEREGWEPTAHRFRELTVAELIANGNTPAKAALLREREKRRVALIYAGKTLAEAEFLADSSEPVPATGVEADALRAEIAKLKSEAAKAQAENAECKAGFEAAWRKLGSERDEVTAERDALLVELAAMKTAMEAEDSGKEEQSGGNPEQHDGNIGQLDGLEATKRHPGRPVGSKAKPKAAAGEAQA